MDAWIQRDDTPAAFRQSRFEDPAYKLFNEQGMLVDVDDEECYVGGLAP